MAVVGRNSPGREGMLSRAKVVDCALTMIARDGADMLTMRRLADELGVSAMTAYYHVASKVELLRLIGDHVLGEVVVPSSDDGSWDVRLAALMTLQRQALKSYPGLREALVGVDMEQRRRLEDAEFDLLVEAGFPPDRVVPAFRVLLDWSLGNARIESSLRDPSIRRAPEAWTKAQRATFDRSLMPALTADDYFEVGLQSVIAGLRWQLEHQQSGRRRRRR